MDECQVRESSHVLVGDSSATTLMYRQSLDLVGSDL